MKSEKLQLLSHMCWNNSKKIETVVGMVLVKIVELVWLAKRSQCHFLGMVAACCERAVVGTRPRIVVDKITKEVRFQNVR